MRTRIRTGEPSAFAELFDSYARAVYNHAFRLTADWSTAEDVMAATFMEAWRLRDRVDPEGGSLRPWLLGIATNTARNQYRTNRRYRAAANAAAAAELSMPDHADEVADRVDDRRRLATVLTSLAALRRPEREVIALCLGEGLDYEAAAEALGIPVGTVASRLSRARKKLRALAEAELARPLAQTLRPATELSRPAAETARKKVRGKREVALPARQIRGDHAHAIRPAQEGNR
ncbi:sigma-70 family RNA polymerase sigma factor [Streptomyces sp. NBC_01275]|uniref:RNA polymerase sigma factor n=1 Tax=Streptomyces sp. NBC_01275 TaxID=2903807 RepID=UPI0022523D60|nr:sigma-70 family RNA polymerase sigma factor [Streptomyces sp. NBC_01275]MCX4762894.1 sigma-70 family RNA polymerase sigma factor [Streptomyces sp. NBC_01275]